MMEIIAEIGQNHNGDMETAMRLIRAAKEGGADVAKFQVYHAESLFSKQDNPWYEYNLATELSRDQVEHLAAECQRVGIEFLASVFDVDRVAWLEEIGVKRYKVASRSIDDAELIGALCATGKPLIISLGMWQGPGLPKVDTEAPIDFLYCISKYPAPLSELRLASVDFSVFAGFSDHSLGLTAAMVAFARGARLVEKHFTLDRRAYGPDHAGSMTPDDLVALDRFRREAASCL